MRAKTDKKRQEIIAVAIDLFVERGCENTTMTDISEAIGGSKPTLYGYFKSKDDLFASAIIEGLGSMTASTCSGLGAENCDVASVLGKFGVAYLKSLMRPRSLALMRAAIAQGQKGTLGAAIYAAGPQRACEELTRYLSWLPAASGLSLSDPAQAARHFKGLLDAGFLEPALLGASVELDIPEAVNAAVDMFLLSYKSPSG